MIRSVFLCIGIALAAGCTKVPATNGATGCPQIPQAAIGKSCAPEGATCGTDPSGFTHFIMCQNGKWAEMEAPPPPPPPPHS